MSFPPAGVGAGTLYRYFTDKAQLWVAVGERLARAEVTRDDVAAVLVGVLGDPGTVGRTFVVVNGETPIPDALRRLRDESA